MIMVIGGYAAGKRQWVKDNLKYQENDFSENIFDKKPILYNLQNGALSGTEEEYELLLQKEVIICDEIGCGLVPIEKNEREHREKIGRCCIRLAQNAEKVVRVYCGIGTYIKE